jgi:2-polyprenyl-3-methyl-5-hydroxy-6-metoxy-1,4-benzoquinol methylase
MRYSNWVLNNRDIFFYKTLQNSLKNCKNVLDVGCGENSPLGKVKKSFYSEGVDIFDPSLSKSKKYKIHDKYKNADIRNLGKLYKEKSFDAVIALDVIEHFKKSTAKKIIKDIEKIAIKKVILLTPNGFYPQDTIGGNPYQVHYSGWSRDDLEHMGYKVKGLRGLKYLRGDYANIRYRPWVIWGGLSFVTEPILHLFPSLSYHLFATKNLDE